MMEWFCKNSFLSHFSAKAQEKELLKRNYKKTETLETLLIFRETETPKKFPMFEKTALWTQPPRFAMDLMSKFHVESSSKLHQFWKTNPHGHYDIDSTGKFRRGFDFQNWQNIDEFSMWIFWRCFDKNRRNFCTRCFHCIIS